MAGRIRDEDIALVREKTPIADIIGEQVQLRNAGGGNLKGICPFHDEKSPSLSVSPARGLYHCLAGETRVLTNTGPVPIADLAGTTATVLTEGGQWVDAPFHDFGVQRLWEITLRRNGRHKTIFATDEHRWFLRHSDRRREKGAERLTRDLKPGQQLAAAASFPTSAMQPAGTRLAATARSAVGTLEPAHLDAPVRDQHHHWVVESMRASERVEPVYCAVVERTHSFVLEDNILTGNCFGCGAGGDVIRFVQNIEHLDFTDAVERLAGRSGIQLRYIEGSNAPKRVPGQRGRLVEAHAEAQRFYAEQLRSPEALTAREFLAERGFDQSVAEQFGCGFAPAEWDALTKHLLAKNFTPQELTIGGLSRESARGGLIDRFHRRLLWPIRDTGGDVVGFGARRLFDDDKVEAKYLNTPETPIYKKSQLLYGVDMAKREIARQHRAVIVEGYTDVMACHLSGVTTAVATCGTAFGSEHVSVIRRLLMDSDSFTGEVIFTFDGDAAGMKAAERAFGDDQKFMAQTFVAIEATGMDPCELRQKSGDTAVLDLVARRIPLVEFVLRSTVGRFDLDTAEGRSTALDRGVPLVAQIKDHGLRDEYARRLGGLVGIDDPLRVVQRVRGMVRSGQRPETPAADRPVENVDPAVAKTEREVLKLALQAPGLAGPEFDALDDAAFLLSAHRSLRAAIRAAGDTSAAVAGPGWTAVIETHLDETLRSGVHALAVEPLRLGPLSEERYANVLLASMHAYVTGRQIVALKSKLQRVNPEDEPERHAQLFAQLIPLEAYHRQLRDRANNAS